MREPVTTISLLLGVSAISAEFCDAPADSIVCGPLAAASPALTTGWLVGLSTSVDVASALLLAIGTTSDGPFSVGALTLGCC